MDKKRIELLSRIAKVLLLIIGSFWFVFALISGSEEVGVVKNSPNVIPWLFLLIFIWVAWKSERPGGILISLFGLAIFALFGFSLFILWVISLPLIVLGSIVVLISFLI